MSRAFLRESEDQWLSDIPPTLNALLAFLAKENNGIKIYEQKMVLDEAGKTIHLMSNGLKYTIGPDGRWNVVS